MARSGNRQPHQGNGEPASSPRRIKAAEKRRQALDLRTSGLTYQQIAHELGYRSAGYVCDIVRAELDKLPKEPAEAVRQLELTRLDAMLLGLWAEAKAGRWLAVDRVLAIMDRRARLLGLDAPVTVDLMPRIRAEAARLAEEYALDADAIIAEAERILSAS